MSGRFQQLSATLKQRRKRIIACFAVALAAVTGFGIAAYAENSPATPVSCTGSTVDSDGHFTLDCTVPVLPAPSPSTVTVTTPVPVPTTVTSTVTTTVTVTPSPTTSTTSTSPPLVAGWPNAGNTGVPTGWVPASTRGSWTITQPGTYTDVRVTGNIAVNAAGVTLRRIEVLGGEIINGACGSAAPLVLEDVTIRPANGQAFVRSTEGAIHHGNFIARRVKILDYAEGMRAGSCGPITVEDSYMVINDNADCQLHSDGIQGYGGRGVTIRNVSIDARKMDCGTAPFFYPRNQGNIAPVDIDRLLLNGGEEFLFRLGVGPAFIRNLWIVDRSWSAAPVDVYCPVVQLWDAKVVDAAGNVVRDITCGGSGT